VLCARRFDDLDEVAREANNSPFGLAASVWTRDISTMHKMCSRIRAGTVWGNCHYRMDPAVPFGGFKQSGLGREQGREGVEAYTELKTVMIEL
jgi:phenylacetaldehyde dehydrogenase